MERNKVLYLRLARLALPIVFQNLLAFSFGLCDSLMLAKLGDEAVSAVYMGNEVQLLLQTLNLGVVGTVVLIGSQYWGIGDKDGVIRALSLGIKLSLALGLIATLASLFLPVHIASAFSKSNGLVPIGADFIRAIAPSLIPFCLSQTLIAGMRSTESVWIGLTVCSVGLAVKLISGIALIFGRLGAPALGILGAAYSTVIARLAELAFALCAVLFFDKKLRIRPKAFLKSGRDMLMLFGKFGSPIMASQLVWAANTLISAAIIGRINEDGALSGISMTSTLTSLSFAVISGAAGAVGVITGKTVGEGKEDELREYSKKIERIFLLLGIAVCMGILLIRNPYLSLYQTGTEAKSVARNLISVLAFTSVATSYQAATLSGLIKSGGDSAFCFRTDLFLLLLAVLPLSLGALRLGLPGEIVFALLKSDQALKCPIAAIKLRKFDWAKRTTSREA